MVAAVWMCPKCVVSVCHRVRNCFQHQSVSFQSALLMDMTLQVPASGDVDRSHFSSKGMDSSAKLRRHKGHLPCSAVETQVFQRQKQLGSNAVVFVNHIQGLGIFCFKIKNWRLTSRLHEILPSTAGHHYKQCKNTHTSYIIIHLHQGSVSSAPFSRPLSPSSLSGTNSKDPASNRPDPFSMPWCSDWAPLRGHSFSAQDMWTKCWQTWMSHDVTCVSAISAYVKETPSALQRRAETRTRFGQWFVEFVELVEPSSCAACAAISIDAGPEPQGLQSLHKQLLSTLKNWKETRGPAPMAPQRKTKYEIWFLSFRVLNSVLGKLRQIPIVQPLHKIQGAECV